VAFLASRFELRTRSRYLILGIAEGNLRPSQASLGLGSGSFQFLECGLSLRP
jgi:hypothetical protein